MQLQIGDKMVANLFLREDIRFQFRLCLDYMIAITKHNRKDLNWPLAKRNQISIVSDIEKRGLCKREEYNGNFNTSKNAGNPLLHNNPYPE